MIQLTWALSRGLRSPRWSAEMMLAIRPLALVGKLASSRTHWGTVPCQPSGSKDRAVFSSTSCSRGVRLRQIARDSFASARVNVGRKQTVSRVGSRALSSKISAATLVTLLLGCGLNDLGFGLTV